MDKVVDFDIADFLRKPDAAAEYLNAIIEEGDQEEFGQALTDLARARGISDLATAANVPYDVVHNVLSEGTAPTIATIQSILNVFGFQLLVVPKQILTSLCPLNPVGCQKGKIVRLRHSETRCFR